LNMLVSEAKDLLPQRQRDMEKSEKRRNIRPK
jgi:hypothetical protein